MKTFISFLSLLFLVNCYSYKNIYYDNEKVYTNTEKTYQITLKDKKTIIGKNLSVKEEYLYYSDRKNNQKKILVESISSIRERYFSYGKTIGLVLGGGAIASIILFKVIMNNFEIGYIPPQ